MVIILIADKLFPPSPALTSHIQGFISIFDLIGQQYDKDIIDGLREVASPRGAGLTFTLFLGLS